MKRVLIIDDDQKSLELLKEELANFCDPITICKSADIIPIFEKEKPYAILSDYMLDDGRTGDEFFSYYKEKNPKIIIIAMSGKEAAGKKLLAQGAHDFIQKPFEIDGLIQVFKKHGLYSP